MGQIKFTQFMRPSGRPVPMTIERPDDICGLAQQIIGAGHCFEAEVLATGEVSLTITSPDGDEDIEVVQNGPAVPEAVDRMVRRFAATLAPAGTP